MIPRLQIIFIAALGLVPLHAWTKLPTSSTECKNFFQNLLYVEKVDPEKYLKLRDTNIKKYFPQTAPHSPQPTIQLVGAKISPENLKAFRGDFDALLDQRAATFQFPASDFRNWLKTKSNTKEAYPDLDPMVVEHFKTKGASLEDVQNVYYFAYAKDMEGKGLKNILSLLHVKELSRMAVSVTKKIGAKGWAIISGAMVAGPVAGVLNSLLSAPLKPVLESSEQASNILFPGIAQAVQSFAAERISGLKEQVTELAATTEALDQYNFQGMDPAEAKKIMDGFEARYYNIFLRMNGFMPPYKRAGRDLVRDWILLQPLQLANNASTFNMEFTMNQSLVMALEEKIKSRGSPSASEEEKNLLEQYKKNMETAENRLAVTLASWKLYNFAFAEVARGPQMKDANALLTDTLTRYQKFMNMDVYRKELSSKVKEAFRNFDPTFTGLEHLQGVNP